MDARDEWISHFQSAFLNEYGCDCATASVELRLDNGPAGALAGAGLQLLQLRLKSDELEELVDAGARNGGDLGAGHLATPVLQQNSPFAQFAFDAIGVSCWQIDLVDGDDDWRSSCFGVIDCLYCLRHHAIVGCNHEDDQVRYSGATGAHRREGGVSRCIQEGDSVVARGLDHVGTDMLRDASRFSFDDVRFAQIVEKRGLAVVDMAHDRDDRRAWLERTLLLVVLGLFEKSLFLFFHRLRAEPELIRDRDNRVHVEALVDAHDDTQLQARGDDFVWPGSHLLGELANRHELSDLENVELFALLPTLFFRPAIISPLRAPFGYLRKGLADIVLYSLCVSGSPTALTHTTAPASAEVLRSSLTRSRIAGGLLSAITLRLFDGLVLASAAFSALAVV